MKLRNKKTGEIKPAEAREDGIYLYDKTTEQWYKYGLSLLAEYWEYYEEPKGHWYIEPRGEVIEFKFGDDIDELKEELSEIGNFFETKEEAEKAVEKLKAWKRLKDKGFRFRWVDEENGLIKYAFFLKGKAEINRFDYEDLNLLFGGEE